MGPFVSWVCPYCVVQCRPFHPSWGPSGEQFCMLRTALMSLLPKPLNNWIGLPKMVHTFDQWAHEILKIFALSYVSAVEMEEVLGELLPGRRRVGMVLKLLKSPKSLWISGCSLIFFPSPSLSLFFQSFWFWVFFFLFVFVFIAMRQFFTRGWPFAVLADRRFWERRWIPGVHKAMGGFSHFHTVLRIKRVAMDTIFNYCKCSWEASINTIFHECEEKREKNRHAQKHTHTRTVLSKQRNLIFSAFDFTFYLHKY